MAALGVEVTYILLWVLSAWALKKMDDHRRSYISEKEYRRLQKEADARDGRAKSLPPPDIQ